MNRKNTGATNKRGLGIVTEPADWTDKGGRGRGACRPMGEGKRGTVGGLGERKREQVILGGRAGCPSSRQALRRCFFPADDPT